MKPSAPKVTYMTMTHAMGETFLAFVANADISCEMARPPSQTNAPLGGIEITLPTL